MVSMVSFRGKWSQAFRTLAEEELVSSVDTKKHIHLCALVATQYRQGYRFGRRQTSNEADSIESFDKTLHLQDGSELSHGSKLQQEDLVRNYYPIVLSTRPSDV
ncbi:hypothetical protein V6N12_007637 [Hibiscus sabdariffa]|uniref:Uncharacterized protein n=1 Tax=Hibiscus sabdariffa TaxID=183260 RepID=A0ABR2F2B9_9ROSI